MDDFKRRREHLVGIGGCRCGCCNRGCGQGCGKRNQRLLTQKARASLKREVAKQIREEEES